MLLSLENLKTAWARGLARGPSNYTAGVTELVIRADLGSSKDISAVGVCGLNDAVADGSIKFSTVSAGASDAGTATIANDGLNGQTHGNSLWYVGAKFCRYIEITVYVYALPSGQRYVDARRLLIMSADGTSATTVTLSAGVNFDWSLTNIDTSEAQVTARGGVFVNTQGTYRALQFSVSGMTSTEAEALRIWLARARRTTECVVSLRTEDTDEMQSNRTIYGRLVDWSPIQHTGGDTYECAGITVHETPYPAL